MTQVEMIKELLREEFGIETEEQLDEAMKKMGGLNIGVFVSPIKRPMQQGGKEWRAWNEKDCEVGQEEMALHTGYVGRSGDYAERDTSGL